MKMQINKILCLFLITAGSLSLQAQEYENMLLSHIIENINNYKNKNITLKLRYKKIDLNIDQIAFYDRKNTVIIFDISELKKTNSFKKQKLNLHEGLEYLVKFTVKDLAAGDNLKGNLLDFEPEILSKLPDGIKQEKKIKKAE